MDIMLIGEDQSQANQPNSLAEGPPPHAERSGDAIFYQCFRAQLRYRLQGVWREVESMDLSLCLALIQRLYSKAVLAEGSFT
eukprot:1145642-Pelagomonas_calceolata.AAC.1